MNKTLGDSFHFERAGLRLKNRAVLAPLTHNMSGAGGDPGQAELDWLARCARGGFGLLIAAATQVQPGGRCWAGQPALMTDAQQQAFTALADSARQAGALAVVQLHHGGMRALPELNDGAPVGPCALAPGGRYPLGVKGLSEEEILTLIDAFVSAAERAHGAGLHGVELHAAHHFLLCNFLNPLHNRRTDRWGGSLANRARILVEIVRGIRARLPRGVLVGVRLPRELCPYPGHRTGPSAGGGAPAGGRGARLPALLHGGQLQGSGGGSRRRRPAGGGKGRVGRAGAAHGGGQD